MDAQQILRGAAVSPPSAGTIYFMRMGDSGPVKIGHAGDPRRRLATLQTGNPEDLSLLFTMPGDQVLERALHHHFADVRLRGEWFEAAAVLAFIDMASTKLRHRRRYVPVAGSFEDYVLSLDQSDDPTGDFVADTQSASGSLRGIGGITTLTALVCHLVYRCGADSEVVEIAKDLWADFCAARGHDEFDEIVDYSSHSSARPIARSNDALHSASGGNT